MHLIAFHWRELGELRFDLKSLYESLEAFVLGDMRRNFRRPPASSRHIPSQDNRGMVTKMIAVSVERRQVSSF